MINTIGVTYATCESYTLQSIQINYGITPRGLKILIHDAHPEYFEDVGPDALHLWWICAKTNLPHDTTTIDENEPIVPHYPVAASQGYFLIEIPQWFYTFYLTV
jgi:hypothetical protein